MSFRRIARDLTVSAIAVLSMGLVAQSANAFDNSLVQDITGHYHMRIKNPAQSAVAWRQAMTFPKAGVQGKDVADRISMAQAAAGAISLFYEQGWLNGDNRRAMEDARLSPAYASNQAAKWMAMLNNTTLPDSPYNTSAKKTLATLAKAMEHFAIQGVDMAKMDARIAANGRQLDVQSKPDAQTYGKVVITRSQVKGPDRKPTPFTAYTPAGK